LETPWSRNDLIFRILKITGKDSWFLKWMYVLNVFYEFRHVPQLCSLAVAEEQNEYLYFCGLWNNEVLSSGQTKVTADWTDVRLGRLCSLLTAAAGSQASPVCLGLYTALTSKTDLKFPGHDIVPTFLLLVYTICISR
jgi:hypothetical protein